MDWKAFAWIKRGKRRKEVLQLLSNSKKPMTATDIKTKLNMSLPQVSFLLKELNEKKLIKCLNTEDKIGKLFITETKGEKILDELEK